MKVFLFLFLSALVFSACSQQSQTIVQTKEVPITEIEQATRSFLGQGFNLRGVAVKPYGNNIYLVVLDGEYIDKAQKLPNMPLIAQLYSSGGKFYWKVSPPRDWTEFQLLLGIKGSKDASGE